jgi:hypothetical protein
MTITDGDPLSVAERPVALPPRQTERAMPHPIAVRCLANTIAAARKSREMDDRLAASDADDIDRLAKSREAVAESEHLLARLKRDGK